ncbi:MAG: hypothetical protein M1830_002653 [Pleopsidium flavum]|nr:MAG: hypothetical protein M1830_002653 [Pleopsidium flavum]
MGAISVQWTLNETAGSTISVAKGLIRAASSDNIQALALIACQAFGATLAICPETCMKVERIAGMHHQSAAVKFLKAQIGYSSGDSAAQLSLDASGVRFLGLAAALGTLGAFQGARALESMLANSAQDKKKQPLPTVMQLKDLLSALDHKLNRAGFAESLAGWGIWFTNNPLLSAEERTALGLQIAASPEEVEQLVKALGELARLGDATHVTVTVGVAAPWVTAFIKWSLGMPPSMMLKDGTSILDQPGCNLTLVVIPARGFFGKMEISISRHMGTPAEIIEAPSGQENWTGMVSVRKYARHRLQRLEMHSGLAKRAILQALPYAVKQASSLLQPEDLTKYDQDMKPLWKHDRENRVVYDLNVKQHLPEELADVAGNMFETDSVLSLALSEFMDVEIATLLPTLPEGTLISDLPLVTLYRNSVKEKCKCVDCAGVSASLYKSCIWKGTLEAISSLVADVLAISLLDCTESVLVYIKSPFHNNLPHLFNESVYAVLAEGKPTACFVEGVIDWVLGLVGHDGSYTEENWIMSSYRGQTFYPRLFETETLQKTGLLVMSGAPGVLRYDEQVYKKATSARFERRRMAGTPNTITSRLSTVPVKGPLNLLSKHSIKWQVTVGDNLLYVALLSTASSATFNPFAVICAAIKSLYIEDCPHSPDAPLAKADEFAAYTSPYFPWGEGNKKPTKLGVVPVHGNEGLRMLSLVAGIPGVVQLNACLQCSLDVCRKANYAFVVDGRFCDE